MAKSKSKRRKKKLARPPKAKTQAAPVGEIPTLPPEFYTASSAGDAPERVGVASDPSPRQGSNNESQSPYRWHPSLYVSKSYQNFITNLTAIRAALPEAQKEFATYDLPELKQRHWLTRYCIKKEKGEIAVWQRTLLEEAGYNWVRGHKPVPKRVKGPSRRARKEAAWSQAYTALRQALEKAQGGATGSAAGMLALLRCDDVHYDWLRKQVIAIRKEKLSAAEKERLQALPFDLAAVVADRTFTKWRTAFKNYEAGDKKGDKGWASVQRRAKRKGTLLPWRSEVLDCIDFDWSIQSAASVITPAEVKALTLKRMEARWRAKLDLYLELEEKYGKPLSMQIEATKPVRPWLSRIREKYNKGLLRPELVAEFEKRGFEFVAGASRQRKWERQYQKLLQFKRRFGHVRVPSSFVDDPELGVWVARQQERMRLGKLRGENLAKLEAIGVKKSRAEESDPAAKTHISVWLKVFREIEAIVRTEHGGRLPPVGQFPEKYRTWMKSQRTKIERDELDAWQLEKLDAIGLDPTQLPEPPDPVDWNERLERLRHFAAEHGHTRVTRSCPDKKLYNFVQRVRLRKRRNDLSPEELRDLRAVGFSFNPRGEVSPAWQRCYDTLVAYHREHGDSDVPRVYPADQALAEFVAQQKQRGRIGLLLAEHIRLLDAVDFRWSGGRPVAKDA